jgi:hypothetical protein
VSPSSSCPAYPAWAQYPDASHYSLFFKITLPFFFNLSDLYSLDFSCQSTSMKSFSLIALAAFPFIVNAFVTPQKAQPDVLPTPQKAQPDVLPTPQKAQPDVLTTPQKAQPDVFPFQAIAPSEVYIRDVPKYAGSGCPEKSASVVLTEDKKAFTIAMSKFSGYIGPGNPAPPVTRLNCQINIDLYVPPGFQYSVFNTTYRGYVDLDDNTEATFAVSKMLIPTSFDGYLFFQ